MTTCASSRDYLLRGSTCSSSGRGTCSNEKDLWGVFVQVCNIKQENIKMIYGLGYTSIKRLSMLGLQKDYRFLVEAAGVSEAKAHMIHLFATFLIHCKYHKIPLSKDLTFDHVLEFNFLLANPGEYQQLGREKEPAAPACSAFRTSSMRSAGSKGSRSSKSKSSSRSSSSKKKKKANAPKITRRRNTVKQEMDSSSTCERSICSKSTCSKSSLRSGKSKSSFKKSVSWDLGFHPTCAVHLDMSKNNKTSNSWRKIPSIDEETASTVDSSSRWNSNASIASSSTSPGRIPPPPMIMDDHSHSSLASSTSCPSLRRMSRSETSRWSSCTNETSQTRTTSTTTRGVASSNSDELLARPSRRPSIGVLMEDMETADLIKEFESLEENEEPKTNKPLETAPPTKDDPCNILLALPSEHAPPKDAAARSSLRWAQALDVDEDLTDSDWSDSDSEYDCSDWDSDDDDDSDSENEDEEEEEAETAAPRKENTVKKVSTKATTQSLTWKSHNVTIEEWTMPANKILPVNLQDLFRQAANNPDLDIQQQIHQALAQSVVTLPPTAA